MPAELQPALAACPVGNPTEGEAHSRVLPSVPTGIWGGSGEAEMAGFGAQGEHASSPQAQTAAAIGLPREKFQQYRQKAGQEKPNCQQRRMS